MVSTSQRVNDKFASKVSHKYNMLANFFQVSITSVGCNLEDVNFFLSLCSSLFNRFFFILSSFLFKYIKTKIK